MIAAGCTSRSTPERMNGASATTHPSLLAEQGQVRISPRKFNKGEVLYLRYCADCHGWQGSGYGPAAAIAGSSPPALNKAGLFTEYSEDELVDWVLFGRLLISTSDKTIGAKTSSEVTALVDYIRQLPLISWNKVYAGQEVYDGLCVGCHGIYGRGDGDWAINIPVPPRDLSGSIYRSELSDQQLYKIIAEGKGAMPAAADVLSLDDIQNVIAFVRILSPGFEIYDRNCALCHGSDGVPIELAFLDDSGKEFGHSEIPVFNTEYFQKRSEEQIRSGIKHMLDEYWLSMPHFAGELSKGEIREILSYLRTLNLDSEPVPR